MADADLRQAIVIGTIRRQPDLDFESANQAGLKSLEDSEVLAIAARKGSHLSAMIGRRCQPRLAPSLFHKKASGVLIIS